MLGRGTYSVPNKILPGIYVKCNFKEPILGNSIKLYAISDGDNITLKLTTPFVFNYTHDGKGNVLLSNTHDYTLYTINDGVGNITMEVKS